MVIKRRISRNIKEDRLEIMRKILRLIRIVILRNYVKKRI